MKRAKKPFRREKFNKNIELYIENCSSLIEVPCYKDFQLWVKKALRTHYKAIYISVVLCDEVEARAYNLRYRQKDYATNVLSFALNEGESFLQQGILTGDLIICPEVVTKEAKEQHKEQQAHFAHLTVHGVLHLCGYDHIEESDAKIMEALEIDILNQLGYSNPYL